MARDLVLRGHIERYTEGFSILGFAMIFHGKYVVSGVWKNKELGSKFNLTESF